MAVPIRVSGNIIKELSEKIPSNNVALNELIKNSYDADASEITITINTTNKKLTIEDNGSGMDEDSIKALFHISRSTKTYGELRTTGRYTLGSKGLGFLSVFKFGNQVTWYTKTSVTDCYEFSVTKSALEALDNLSDHHIDLIQSEKLTDKGTLIEIELDDYNSSSLSNYFSDIKNCKKLVNCFYDDNIKITLIIDGKSYTTENISLDTIHSDYILYHVTYDSTNNTIKYFYNNLNFYNQLFDANIVDATIKMDLNIYLLRSGGTRQINSLFHNDSNKLTPLIYVNKNLFNNYSLFNPDAVRSIRAGKTLPQIIGFIDIRSTSQELDFNSDRTQFTQNPFTDKICDFLKTINIKLQEEGSKFKNLVKTDKFLTVDILPEALYNHTSIEEFRAFISNNYPLKDFVEISVENHKVTYKILNIEHTLNIAPPTSTTNNSAQGNHTGNSNNQNGNNTAADNTATTENTEEDDNNSNPNESGAPASTTFVPVSINLSSKSTEISIPSDQFPLLDYIESLTDSSGANVDKSKLTITVDNAACPTKILSTITSPTYKIITFTYTDESTGIASKQIKLSFKEPTAAIISSSTDNLITIPARSNYTIDYNKNVADLIFQINSLDLNTHPEVIACSLRAIFDLSVASIRTSPKFVGKITINNDLPNNVKHIVQYILDNALSHTIATSASISFHSLNNSLNADEFERTIKKAHLGAHQSTLYLTQQDIKDIAKKAGIFVILSNELIMNPSIT